MAKRILFSGFKWSHIEERSGYNQIAPKGRDYVDGGRLFGGGAPLGTIRSRMNMVLIDLVTCYRGLRYDCVLIFHPEQTVYISPLLLKLMGVKVVFTTHMNEDYWFGRSGGHSQRRRLWLTRFVDHFIVLCRSEMPVFESRFPGKVTCIPHGKWSDEPLAEPQPSTAEIIVVGDAYRDYRLLGEVLLLFKERFPNVIFHLVGMVIAKLPLNPVPDNVRIHGWLSGEEYRALMSRCAFMFLPLTFATANNALLEAISLGVPVVCSAVGGIKDYLPSTSYMVNDAEALATFYRRQQAMTQAERLAERQFIRDHCLRNFDWNVIRGQIQALVETICASPDTSLRANGALPPSDQGRI